jgi:hypothetical protein
MIVFLLTRDNNHKVILSEKDIKVSFLNCECEKMTNEKIEHFSEKVIKKYPYRELLSIKVFNNYNSSLALVGIKEYRDSSIYISEDLFYDSGYDFEKGKEYDCVIPIFSKNEISQGELITIINNSDIKLSGFIINDNSKEKRFECALRIA